VSLEEKCYVSREEYLLKMAVGTVVIIGVPLPSGEAKGVQVVENAPLVYGHGQLWTCLAQMGLVKIPLPAR